MLQIYHKNVIKTKFSIFFSTFLFNISKKYVSLHRFSEDQGLIEAPFS